MSYRPVAGAPAPSRTAVSRLSAEGSAPELRENWWETGRVERRARAGAGLRPAEGTAPPYLRLPKMVFPKNGGEAGIRNPSRRRLALASNEARQPWPIALSILVAEGGGIEPLARPASTLVFETSCRPFGGTLRYLVPAERFERSTSRF